ncbi:MAG: polyprenyl synthetase family protein [Chloroflexota bacterium]
MSTELQRQFETLLPAIEAEMRAVLHATTPNPDAFYGMIHYHMGWADEQLQPLTVKSGKNIRPVLCLLICQAAGGNWEQAVPAAAAIEILHNFSLVHDDIEDISPTRRGRPTVWTLWGKPLAINTGDAMFALAHLALARLADRGVDTARVVRALRRFDEVCVQLTQGQHADMSFETRSEVGVNEYIEMITGKTAVLISLCAELGALVAGCDDETIAHYATFGRNIGLAFQVIDDILGIWGDEALIGKSTSTDITTKKKTLPVLFGLERSQPLRQLYAETQETNQQFVTEVTALLTQNGADVFANERAEYYSQTAVSHLEAAQPTGPGYTALNQLVEMLLNRNH